MSSDKQDVPSLARKDRQHRRARDYLIRRGSCNLCSKLLRSWPGWPRDAQWQVFPGELILPRNEAFMPSWLDRHWRLDSSEENISEKNLVKREWDVVTRHRSLIAYGSCDLCAMIYSALSLRDCEDDTVSIKLAPTGPETVLVHLKTVRGYSDNKLATLQLHLVLDVAQYEASLQAYSDFTGSPGSISRLRDRLHDCQCHAATSSDDTESESTRWLPTRLIEVRGAGDGPPLARIVHSHQITNTVSYLTLSHRWDRRRTMILTKSNIKAFEAGIPWNSIPAKYQDALRLTIELGRNYIWIDSLCIIQDSREDWELEAVSMSKVYTKTSLNIFASGDCGDDKNLFRFRDSSLSIGFALRNRWPGMTGSLWHCQPLPRKAFEQDHVSSVNSTLSTRAWIFQEELLPPAIAYIGNQSISWICVHGFAFETATGISGGEDTLQTCHASKPTGSSAINVYEKIYLKRALRGKLSTEAEKQRFGSDPLELWYDIIRSYSRRDITFETDKLVAMAGLAPKFGSLLGLEDGDYLAGHWRPYLLTSLLWKSPLSDREAGIGGRYANFIAPSWSWASVSGRVTNSDYEPVNLAELVHAEVMTSGNVYGQAVSGHILVKAPVWKVVINTRLLDECGDILLEMDCGHSFVPLIHDTQIDDEPKFDDTGHSSPYYFMAIKLLPNGCPQNDDQGFSGQLYGAVDIFGLLMERVAGRDGEYHRAGVARIPFEDMAHTGCTKHNLPQDCFLDKHRGSTPVRDVLLGDISKLTSLKDRVISRDAEGVARLKQAFEHWRLVGQVYWPQEYIDPPEDGIWIDEQYTVKII